MIPPTVEVLCLDGMCFRANAVTLDAVTCSYYEPAARQDPRGPQMSHGEWLQRRSAITEAKLCPKPQKSARKR